MKGTEIYISGTPGTGQEGLRMRLVLIMSMFFLISFSNFYVYILIDVSDVSPRTGSVKGGTLLSLTGKQFDSVKARVKVKVADVPCKAEDVKPEMIKCRTGEHDITMTDGGDVYAGNKMLKHLLTFCKTSV